MELFPQINMKSGFSFVICMDRVGQKWDGFVFALLKILLFCLRELLQSYVTNLIWRIEVPVDQTVTKLKPNNREIFVCVLKLWLDFKF